MAGDPTFIALEVDADQTEVLFVGKIQAAGVPAGAAVIGFLDHSIAAHDVAMGGIGEGDIQRVALGFQGLGLPWAGGGRRQVGGDAAAEAEAQNGHQHEIQQR